MDDTFTLYDLKVEVVAGDRPMVCSHKAGDYFLVQGENLVFPKDTSFSMYSLSALLPLLPAKQRPLDPNDWMLSDTEIACPDPKSWAVYRGADPETGERKRSLRKEEIYHAEKMSI